MGRAPCCDKASVKKGPWSPEEDAKLKSYIEKHGTGGNWIALPQKIGLKRCGKSCRLRWLNYLRPNIKHGDFSEEEDNLICSLYISIGSRWSIIAAQLPGRTDNDIKNYWNTRLKKKLLGDQRTQITKRRSGNNPKREVKMEIDGDYNDLAADNIGIMNYRSSNHLMLYCPAMALPTSTLLQPPTEQNNHQRLLPSNFDDHTSIRKLLVKLGGRFSDDNSHAISDCLPDIDDGSLSGNPSYERLATTNSRIPEPCKKDGVGFVPEVHLPRRDNRFTPGFVTNEVYSQDGLQGLEFLLGYDETIALDSPRQFSGSYSGCGPVAGWDEISNLVHAGNLMQ